MKILIGADHGGFHLKQMMTTFLQAKGYEIEDCGAFQFDPTDDYPQYATKVSKRVIELQINGQNSFGILLCRFGGGMTIMANKNKGIRAVMPTSVLGVKKAREDNDANVLVISGDLTNQENAKEIIESFLQTNFSSEERHKRRVAQIEAYEQQVFK